VNIDLEARAAEARRRIPELAEAGVEAVACGFVDPAAIVRTKCIPLRRLEEAAGTGIGLSTVFALALSNDEFTTAPGYVEGPSGDLRLMPDPSHIVAIDPMPGWAWAPVDQFTQEREPWAGCPRSFLRRAVDDLEGRGLTVRAAFEFEFSFGRDLPDGRVEPAHTGPGYSDVALVQHHDLALDLIRAIERQGVELQQFHPEYTDGQFEISIAPTDPLTMADTVLVIKQTVRAIGRRYGWRASFSPRTFGPVGNGMHLHLSLWRDSRNQLAGGEGPAGLTREGEAFIAGMYRHLPAVVAIACPSPLSYARLQPHHWSGATLCWGQENREAALRFIQGMAGTRDRAANIEVKPIDGTSNPYLAMGAVLAAATAGIEDGLALPEQTTEDPSELSSEERERRGIRQLPDSLGAAIEELTRSSMLRKAMGDLLFETFLATRRADEQACAGIDEEEIARRYRWRY
jgi:glutamine synthetase